MLNKLKDLIFLLEGNCYLCRESYGKNYICQDCREKLDLVNSVYKEEIEGINKIYIAAFYNRFIKEKIWEFKFKNKAYLYKTFARLMLDTIKERDHGDIDIVIPIPIYKTRKRARGYNQAELLAKELAKGLNASYDFKTLVKTRDTRPQSQLSSLERRSNLKASFRLENGEKLRGKRILLVDDVLTTGSTFKEAARTLNREDNLEITGIVLASTYT